MKLIIVQRAKLGTYGRLRDQFFDDRNVQVILERRQLNRERRSATDVYRPPYERRRLNKPFDGRDFIVVYNTNAHHN